MSRLERRIAELVRRWSLPAAAGGQLQVLLEVLAEDPAAPTALRDRERVLDDHLADALVALGLGPVRTAATVVDIGSGAGVPGLPLAIAKPRAEFTLVESNGRKCSFIARAAAACGLVNVDVVNARVEAWTADGGRFELVTARALAPLAVVVEYAAPLLVQGGRVIAWRGGRDPTAEAAATAAAHQLGLAAAAIEPVQPYPGAKRRHLHVFAKEKPTPAGFPRRPGVARKRPLGQGAHSI